MNDFQSKLIGALIGMARATDGNEHLITKESTAVVLECLAAKPESEDSLQAFLKKVDDAKRKMVPDCYLCANPCGRTSAYAFSEMQKEESSVQDAKMQILSALQQVSLTPDAVKKEELLYQGLIAVGMEDLSPEFLASLADSISK